MRTYHTVKENKKVVVVCKLGTTENMYYVRREEAYMIRSFDADPRIKLLFMDLSVIWRFHWPDEDIALNYQNEETFKESYQKIVDAVAKRDPRSLIFNTSFNGCSKDHEANCSEQDRFNLLGDRYSEISGSRTIFSCLSCNKLYAFSKTEIDQVIKPGVLSLTGYPKDFLEKVVQRINPYHLA
jgi:hypothetical protein